MFIYRIIGMRHADEAATVKFPESFGETVPERIIVFSDSLTVDSHGHCAILRDKQAKQTKYLFRDEQRCQECGNCSKTPLLVDTIQAMDRRTDVELKSSHMAVTSQAEAYCRANGVSVVVIQPFAGTSIGDNPA